MYKKLKITDVVPYDKNPRVHNEAPKYILESLKEHGQVAPILVNDIGYPFDKHVVCAGHGRLKALQEFGVQEISVYVHKFRDEKQFADYCIRDNKTSEFSSWDDSILAELAGDFDLAMEEMGFGDFDNIQKVNSGDENDEWVGMPEFEAQEKRFSIVIQFETEEYRDEFHAKYPFEIMRKQSKAWSTHYPFEGMDDCASVEFESDE